MVNLRIRFSLPVVATILLSAMVGYAAEDATRGSEFAWIPDLNTAWRMARENERPLLLFLTMDGCTHCQKMKQTTLKDKGIQHDLQSRFVSVNLDSKDEPELVKALKVRYFPTLVIIQPNGDVVENIQGYQSVKQLHKRLMTSQRNASRDQGRTSR